MISALVAASSDKLKVVKNYLPSLVEFHKPSGWVGSDLLGVEKEAFDTTKLAIKQYYSIGVNHYLLSQIGDLINSICRLNFSVKILAQIFEYLRIKLLSDNPSIVEKTTILLDYLIKNSDYHVHLEIGRRHFIKTISRTARRHMETADMIHHRTAEYMFDALQAWGEAFESRRHIYPHIYNTYANLRYKHHVIFSRMEYDPTRVPIFLGPITAKEIKLANQFNAESILESYPHPTESFTTSSSHATQGQQDHRKDRREEIYVDYLDQPNAPTSGLDTLYEDQGVNVVDAVSEQTLEVWWPLSTDTDMLAVPRHAPPPPPPPLPPSQPPLAIMDMQFAREYNIHPPPTLFLENQPIESISPRFTKTISLVAPISSLEQWHTGAGNEGRGCGRGSPNFMRPSVSLSGGLARDSPPKITAQIEQSQSELAALGGLDENISNLMHQLQLTQPMSKTQHEFSDHSIRASQAADTAIISYFQSQIDPMSNILTSSEVEPVESAMSFSEPNTHATSPTPSPMLSSALPPFHPNQSQWPSRSRSMAHEQRDNVIDAAAETPVLPDTPSCEDIQTGTRTSYISQKSKTYVTPSSDPTLEVRYYGQQRVLVKKKEYRTPL